MARAGYNGDDWEQLLGDIREQILTLDALFVETADYGEVYEIRAKLVGPNGVALKVVTIWIIERASGDTKFITLYPDRKA